MTTPLQLAEYTLTCAAAGYQQQNPNLPEPSVTVGDAEVSLLTRGGESANPYLERDYDVTIRVAVGGDGCYTLTTLMTGGILTGGSPAPEEKSVLTGRDLLSLLQQEPDFEAHR